MSHTHTKWTHERHWESTTCDVDHVFTVCITGKWVVIYRTVCVLFFFFMLCHRKDFTSVSFNTIHLRISKKNISNFLVSQLDNASFCNYAIKEASRLLGLAFKCQALLCWNYFSTVYSGFLLAKLQWLWISWISCDLHSRISLENLHMKHFGTAKKK